MNQSSVLRAKMRTALLSTTGICAAALMMPSAALAVPVIERVGDGEQVSLNDYTFWMDITVENPGSSLTARNAQLADGARLTVRDWGRAEFKSIIVSTDTRGGQILVSDGGNLFVVNDMTTTDTINGYADITVTGENSLLEVGGNLEYVTFGNVDSRFEISNGGTLNVSGTLTLTSAGIESFGRPRLWIGGQDWNAPKASGQLNADSIVLNRHTGIIFNHTDRFEYTGELVGAGYLSAQAGHTVLSGDGSLFTGSVHYEEGSTLEINGHLGGTVYLGNGNLTGTGSIDYLNLSAALAGTIRPRATTPTIGRLDVGVYSTLFVEVDPEGGQSSALRVTGQATIGEGTELVHIQGANSNFRRSASYLIIDAAGGVQGQFEYVRSDYAFLDVSVDYTDTQVIMNLDRNDIRFSDIAETANQRAVANAIEGIDANMNLSDLVIDQNDATARLGFTQMAGELHASARSSMMLDAASLRQTLIGSVAGQEASGQTYGVWGRALTSATKLDGRDGNAELKSDTTGFVAGIDKAIGSSVRAGVMVGFETAKMKSKGLGQIDRDSQHLGLYGRGDWGRLNVQAGTVASWHSLSSSRDIAFGNAAEILKGDYDASSQQAYVEAAWSVPMAWATVSPYASLAFNALDVDAVGEKGGVTALDIQDSTQDLTTAGLGVAAEKRWTVSSGRAANLKARIGWESYSGDLEAVQNVAFADSAAFDIEGLPMGDEAFVAGVSVAVPVGKAGTVSLDWNGLKGSDQSRNALAVSYRLNF